MSSGLPDPWLGRLVVPDWASAGVPAPPPEQPVRFRCQFDLPDVVTCAELFVTACGILQAELDGAPIGDEILAPGWTSYRDRHRVRRHDLTELLAPGPHVLGITVAEGWYRGRLGFTGGNRATFGDEIGPIVHLVVHHHDGTVTTVVSDCGWRAAPSAVRAACLYDGESTDLRALEPEWSTPGYDDRDWAPVREATFDPAVLFLGVGPPVRRIEELAPVSVTPAPSGALVVDFGQNIAGRIRARIPAGPGEVITFQHAEVLEAGELARETLRSAAATDEVTCGAEPLVWEPEFTIHGFRYAAITGWPGTLEPDDLRAVVCHSDLEELGHFACSDPLLARLHENVRWSAKGNFVDVPTDCPQRDERFGWTGDLQVFAPTACFLFDCADMLDSWLQDLAADQVRYGTVPPWSPFFQFGPDPIPLAGWGDAAVIVPWTLYWHFGDAEILVRHLPMMRRWVDDVADRVGSSHLWEEGLQLGDWLDPSAPPDQPWRSRADAKLVATAYHARTAALLARAEAVAGTPVGAARARGLASEISAAFAAEYVTPSGRTVSDAPTAYALALCFDLLPTPAQRDRAARRLRHLVHADGHHISTGFIGTPFVCDALADAGWVDDAWHLLTQTECPSWLYPITMGATTTWERWDAIRPDGTINTGEMTSFNHYALGAVADFLHRRVAGIGPAAPGYRHLSIRPLPGGGLQWATASRRTPFGPAAVRWERAGDELVVMLDVPQGVEASVELPDDSPTTRVGPGHHELRCRFRNPAQDPPRPAPLNGRIAPELT